MGVGIERENTKLKESAEGLPKKRLILGGGAVRGYAGKTCIYEYLSNQENLEL